MFFESLTSGTEIRIFTYINHICDYADEIPLRMRLTQNHSGLARSTAHAPIALVLVVGRRGINILRDGRLGHTHYLAEYSRMASVRKMVIPIGAATCEAHGAQQSPRTNTSGAQLTAIRLRCIPRVKKPIPSCFQSRLVVATTFSSV